MQLRIFIFSALAIAQLVLLPTLSSAASSQSVKFITEEVPPVVYFHKGTLKGYNIALIKKIWTKMNLPEQKITVQPWPRSIKDFDTAPPTCLFPVALTEERKKKYRYVSSPMFFDIVIMAHKKDKLLFSTPEQLKNVRICVTKAASVLPVLLRNGYSEANFDFATSLACSIKKFQKGRAPLIVGSAPLITYNYQVSGGDPSDLIIVARVAELPNGFLFNDAVPQHFIENMKQAMLHIALSREAQTLYNQEISPYHPNSH